MNKDKICKVIMITALMAVLTSGCKEPRKPELFEASTESIGPETEGKTQETAGIQPESGTERALICVQVCGAVVNPGVVMLPAGSRVFEAISKAGGLDEKADERSVNQAELLSDGQQVVVLTSEEMQEQPLLSASGQAESAGTQMQKVNLNTATAEELMTLRGIGEAKAADIIAYRDNSGGFQTIEEIKNISGIKDAVFEKIKDQITV